MNNLNRWSRILQLLKQAVHKLRHIAQIRWLRWTIQTIVIALCLIYLAINLKNAQEILAGLKPDFSNLFAALGLTIVAVFLGASGWWFTLRALGQPVNWLGSARAHCLSNLAKYIPGYAWQLLGKAYLTNQMGLPNSAVGLGMFLELLNLLLTGIFLGLILLPADLVLQWSNSQPLTSLLPFIRALCLILLGLFPMIISSTLKRRYGDQPGLQIVPAMIWAAALTSLVAWLFFGLAFWLLGASMTPVPYTKIPLFIFTLAVSLIIGLVIIFVPGGLGIRESIMVLVLSPNYLSAPVAVIVAALSRLIVILSELLSVFLIEITFRKPWEKKIWSTLHKSKVKNHK
ncbi:MAG TPA: lysylphosphatidylglycerol synthase domain-containing protein [Anaerolineales bacterium]|nr:lysylphosphatidylglycerol synthase domain-containing protein [Anaerolineales bacterium]